MYKRLSFSCEAILRGGPHGPGVGKDLISFLPKLYDLRISDTTEQSITLDVLMNLTNPTEYAATVPYMDVNILVNDTIMGHATARNISVGPGNNTGIPIRAVWEPAAQGGVNGNAIGRELLSQYISGMLPAAHASHAMATDTSLTSPQATTRP